MPRCHHLLLLLLPALTLAQDPNILAARDSMQNGDFRKASEALELVLRLDEKSDAELYVMLAVCRANLEDREGALQAAEQGMKVFPGSARVTTYYTAMVPQLLPPTEARARLEKALLDHPTSPLLMKALGKAMLQGKVADAGTGTLLSDSRRLLPQDAEAHFLYGQWACLQQKEAICVEALKKSLTLTPPANYAAVTLTNGSLAVALQRLDRPAEAKQAFERAMAADRRMEPFAPEVAFQYAKFLAARSEKALAQKVLEEILTRSPGFAPAHLERAQALFREERMEKAREQALLALRHSGPDQVQLRAIRSFLVKVCSVLGLSDEASAHQAWVDAHQ